jgi:hypothetical protein
MTWSKPQQGIASLLDDFVAVSRAVAQHERADIPTLKRLLNEYILERKQWTKKQRVRADDFNIMEVLEVADDELRHSATLEWLLDHSLEHRGTHGQGNLGFSLFLDELGLPEKYSEAPYWVRREVLGDESRVDLEIAAYREFVIHIENKIHSSEGYRQTTREAADLSRRAAALGVYDPNQIHGLFLTLDGAEPLDPRFHALSWSRVAHVLERFARRAIPRDVKLFAAHHARALRKFTATQNEETTKV